MKDFRSYILLAVLLTTYPADASQYTGAEIKSVELKAQLDGAASITTVYAETKIENGYNLVAAVTISYQDTIIRIPSETLDKAPNGVFEGVRMAYCEKSAHKIIDLHTGDVTQDHEDGHPCLAIYLDFKESMSNVGAHASNSYMMIEVLGGKVFSYSTWHFDGYNWNRKLEEY